jgi:flagellar hook-length control protein FliK
MPAKSKAQQEFMAIAEHEPDKLRGAKPKMSHDQLHDFAATPTKGLPQKIGRDAEESPAHERRESKAKERSEHLGHDGHPGFAAVQKKIEGEGYSKESAGAILASKSRHASPAAHKANPRLNKVIGHDGKPCGTCQKINDR